MNPYADQPISLLGVPMDLGAENLGVDIGPNAFRYQKLTQKLVASGLDVRDEGNVAVADRAKIAVGNPRLRHLDEIVRVCNATAAETEGYLRSGRRAVVLGGDHSINLGTVAGASNAVGADKLGMVYIDAHGDMNTDETTPTGNIHGMNVAALMGFGAPELTGVGGPERKIDPRNIVHIAGNDFDSAELELMEREHIPNFSIADLLAYNMAPMLKMIDELAGRVEAIWVSLDLDAIDSLYAPGAGMPNQAGLSYREITTIASYIGNRCPVIGVDVVEYNPLQDVDRKTAELGTELIARFFGKQYSWYSGYLEHNKLGV